MQSVLPGLPADARVRLAAALLLAFGFAAVEDWRLTPAILALALAAVVVSGSRPADIAARLRLPGAMALVIVAVLPFAVGSTPLMALGPLTLRVEGLAAAWLVAVRFLGIVAVAAAMLGPLPPLALVRALRGVGVPAPMADLAMLVLRYVDEVRDEFARMRVAAALRGRPISWRRLADIGWLLTALLLRVHARAERQWQAMRVRGHGAARAADIWPAPSTRDMAVLAAAALAASALFAARWLA
jgi:cobalt/nickel transport system permease protein